MMRIPPVGPQRERYNSITVGWTLIVVGFLLFPIGGFLLMAGGIVMLVRARKLKKTPNGAVSAQLLPASAPSPVPDSAAPAQLAMPSADTALDKPFGDTFPISAWIDEDSPFVNDGRVSLYVMDKHKAAIHRIVRADDSFIAEGNSGSGAVAAWGTLVPEPRNRYDSDAVRVEVDGQSVGYLAMEWKHYAHEALAAAHGIPVVVPVVVRWWGPRGESVWMHDSIEDAKSFVAWLHRQDLR